MKVKRSQLVLGEDPPLGLQFWCPGCDEAHSVSIRPGGWTWNGNDELPSIDPSVKCETPKWDEARKEFVPDKICHSTIAGGMITFCPDSTHHLVGQCVAIPDWPL